MKFKVFERDGLFFDVRIILTKNDILFSAIDIGIFLKHSNIHKIINNSDSDEKKYQVIKTNGGPQKVIFLTTNGIKNLVCKSRSPYCLDLAKQIHVNVNNTVYLAFETSIIKFLMDIYKSEKIIYQYPIQNYRIDLYFVEHKIAIECDEFDHGYKKEEDKIRENILKTNLGCIFLRFKQQKTSYENFELLSKLIKIINFLIFQKKDSNKDELQKINNEIETYFTL